MDNIRLENKYNEIKNGVVRYYYDEFYRYALNEFKSNYWNFKQYLIKNRYGLLDNFDSVIICKSNKFEIEFKVNDIGLGFNEDDKYMCKLLAYGVREDIPNMHKLKLSYNFHQGTMDIILNNDILLSEFDNYRCNNSILLVDGKFKELFENDYNNFKIKINNYLIRQLKVEDYKEDLIALFQSFINEFEDLTDEDKAIDNLDLSLNNEDNEYYKKAIEDIFSLISKDDLKYSILNDVNEYLYCECLNYNDEDIILTQEISNEIKYIYELELDCYNSVKDNQLKFKFKKEIDDNDFINDADGMFFTFKGNNRISIFKKDIYDEDLVLRIDSDLRYLLNELGLDDYKIGNYINSLDWILDKLNNDFE